MRRWTKARSTSSRRVTNTGPQRRLVVRAGGTDARPRHGERLACRRRDVRPTDLFGHSIDGSTPAAGSGSGPERVRPAQEVSRCIPACSSCHTRARSANGLCRYASRPPVANERLARTASDRVRYTLKRSYLDDTNGLRINPGPAHRGSCCDSALETPTFEIRSIRARWWGCEAAAPRTVRSGAVP